VAAAVAVVAGAIGAFLVLSGGAGPPATPTGLTAAAQPLDVSLRWTQPAEGERAVQWKVFRDGALLGATRQTSFADNSVTPGQTYTYAVRAIGQDARTSAAAARTVTAQIPSIGYARLTGTFSVHVKVIQSTGFSGAYTGTQFDEAWVFTPVCSSGPCDVNWVNNDQKAMTNSLLSRNGFTYTGISDGDFGVSCGTGQSKVAVSSHLEMTLQVTGGGVSGSAWVATKLTGTLSEVEPASGSCHASSATDQVTLTLTS
jgi:hypothetical protein